MCEDCYLFEVNQLPLLLAGDVFFCQTSKRSRWYLRLAADQSSMIWTPWQDEDESHEAAEISTSLARIWCVSVARSGRALELSVTEAGRLRFEAETEQVCIA